MTSPDSPATSGPILRTVADFQRVVPNTALAHHGVEIVEVGAERAVLALTITANEKQPMGLLHGGISLFLAESAASLHACWNIDLSAQFPVGIEVNGSHIRSSTGGRIRAIATVIRRSRALIVHQVEIQQEETGELISTCRVTNYYRPAKRPS